MAPSSISARAGASYYKASIFRKVLKISRASICLTVRRTGVYLRLVLGALNYVEILRSASIIELGVLLLLAGASAVSWGLITTMSPSSIASSIMDLPFTRNA